MTKTLMCSVKVPQISNRVAKIRQLQPTSPPRPPLVSGPLVDNQISGSGFRWFADYQILRGSKGRRCYNASWATPQEVAPSPQGLAPQRPPEAHGKYGGRSGATPKARGPGYGPGRLSRRSRGPRYLSVIRLIWTYALRRLLYFTPPCGQVCWCHYMAQDMV